MNISQQQTILTVTQSILDIDLNQLMIETYTGETDFSKVVIAKYNAAELLSLIRKMLTQLKREVESGLGLLLPNKENFQNDFGTITIDAELPTLQTYLQSKQFEAVEPLLDKFIYYQIKNGFWDKSQIMSHPLEEERIKRQQELIELNQQALDANLVIYNQLKQTLDEKLIEITNLIESKNVELSTITTLLRDATDQVAQITALVSSSTNKDTEITGILNNLKDKVELVNINISEYKLAFTTIQEESTKLSDKLKKDIDEATLNLAQSKEGIAFIESRRSQIELLTGMAADGSLGSKFDQRQQRLDTGLNFWRWAVPVMTILSVVWVVIVFTCLNAHFPNEWLNLSVNLIKTSPAFILLGFVLTQYSKERNLQEEYAFKSAVAMTLTAYSNMLANEDDAKNKSRQEMLLRSIEQVYNQPRIHSERKEKLFSFNTKHLSESVKTLTEAVKNIKS